MKNKSLREHIYVVIYCNEKQKFTWTYLCWL